MNERIDVLGRVRIASPCTASWEAMEGDDRVRFCRECSLNVYNLSAMTSAEAESLVAGTEGRLCARFYRRADGTVLTKDCPVGLRALRRRGSLAAGAAFAAMLSLFSVASGKPDKPKQSCPAGGDYSIEKTKNANSYATVSGTAYDVAGSVLSGAEVKLASKDTGRKYTARTSDEGEFIFAAVAPGEYIFEIDAPGFQHFRRDDLYLGAGDAAHVRATVKVGLMGEIVVIEDPKPDIESKDGKTVLRNKVITSLPH